MRYARLGLLLGVLAAGWSCRPASLPAVIAAARSGDTLTLERLLEGGADPNARGGVNGWTVLLHAVHKNQEGSIRMLIAHGADVNATGNGGTTPLIMASRYGNGGVVRILLDADADAYQTDWQGVNALTAAVEGAADIDRFTLWHCQPNTVRTLLAAAPDLHPSGEAAASVLFRMKLAACPEVASLLVRNNPVIAGPARAGAAGGPRRSARAPIEY